MNETQLAIPASKRLEVAQPSTAAMLGAVIQGGITAENVEVLKELIALKVSEDTREAKREFACALIDLQTETPKILASKAVPDNSGNVRYKFAPYEDIMRSVRPLLAKHGFSVTYDQDIADGKVTVKCNLQHRGGHSETNRFTCRIGSGPPKASEAQGDGAATTYAKRFALCASLGITIETDADGGKDEGDGSLITPEQAADLRLRVEAVGGDLARFVKWLGVTSFDDIPASKYAQADGFLRNKEAEARK